MAAPAGGSAREFLRQGVPFLALMTVGSVGLGYMQTGLKEYDDIKREVRHQPRRGDACAGG